MERHTIKNIAEFKQLREYVDTNGFKSIECNFIKSHTIIRFTADEEFIINLGDFNGDEQNTITEWLSHRRESSDQNHLIFGKNDTTHVVSCEITDNQLEVFIEKDGVVSSNRLPHKYWIVSSRKHNPTWALLKGSLHYRFIKFFNSAAEFYTAKRMYRGTDVFCVNDPKESAMILYGITHYKGMKVQDVSALFFDIEATTLELNDQAKVLLISNTFIKNGMITRKLFSYTDYENEGDLFIAWCDWVRSIDPSIVCGHNIFVYDLPYLAFCAEKAGAMLKLGRNGSELRFDKFVSKFRKDGSQSYDYQKAFIYGRELVDTLFVAYHYDVGRKYESYGLKAIIKHEGLEVENRTFYDASTIGKNYTKADEWAKIISYAIFDADDAAALFKLMIPAYFYLAQSIPKSFQSINCSATGSQINSLLIRSYLQQGHSLPKTSITTAYEGAISDGYPGIYKNVFKVDVASLYPSIMVSEGVYDHHKDPNKHFLKMIKYFTTERLENKKKSKDTGDRYYKDLEQSQKIVINSGYGMLAAQGLLFNSPDNAAFITRIGREHLSKAYRWATGTDYIYLESEQIEQLETDGYILL